MLPCAGQRTWGADTPQHAWRDTIHRMAQTPHPKRIAVFTSGGDSQGMNAAVRSLVRFGIASGCEVFIIYEGYQGLVEGGDRIKQLLHKDVSRIIQLGGTVFGTARCKEFRTTEGRKKAAFNLASKGIDALVVIGGDGSLTGADIFRQEWPQYVKELAAEGQISASIAEHCKRLTIVGLAGSIDNDFCGTDSTIGTDSALHRIVECVDTLISTAMSHRRTFVVELMGRHCGYLTLMAGLATTADWILLPETPPDLEDWEDKMCKVLERSRSFGRRYGLVLVSEGAIDRTGKPISANHVKDVIVDRLGHDTRLTVLGHIQRGGSPSANDRIIATLCGAEAVSAVLSATPETDAVFIGISENKVMRRPLMECVNETKNVSKAIADKEFDLALRLRGGDFLQSFQTLRTFKRIEPKVAAPAVASAASPKRIAIVCVGAPAAGMNAAIRCAVRIGLEQGHTMLAVQEGFRGLAEGKIAPISWEQVQGYVGKAGCELGTNRSLPDEDPIAIASALRDHSVDALLLVAGFEGYRAALFMAQNRRAYSPFRIPIVCIPCTLSNNVPGTEYAIGSDTALNVIVAAGDQLKTSADATHRRVFFMETQGGSCGYLATMGALATGADFAYIPEAPVTLSDISDDVKYLRRRFGLAEHQKMSGLVFVTDNTSRVYTAERLADIYNAEGGTHFDARLCVPGHLQQGCSPSPLDRIRATRLARMSMEFLDQQLTSIPENGTETKESACVIGFKGNAIEFSPVQDLVASTDFSARRATDQWWMEMRKLVPILNHAPQLRTAKL